MMGPNGKKHSVDAAASTRFVAGLASGETPETYVNRPKQPRGETRGRARVDATKRQGHQRLSRSAAQARWD